MYFAHRDGLLTASSWAEAERTMNDLIAYPGMQQGGRCGTVGKRKSLPVFSMRLSARVLRHPRLSHNNLRDMPTA